MPIEESSMVSTLFLLTMKKTTADEIVRRLKREYPDAGCSLSYRTPIQVVVATMLSAQSTDQRVNLTTPALFRKYRSARAFANADRDELEEMIKPVGLYHTKAGNIIKMARKVVDDFRGKVPTTVEELQTLPGVGRKSANVIRGELTGDGEGIAVDTHVTRVAFRLGFTEEKDPVKIEKDLTKVIDQKEWVAISHLLIFHGRAICHARRPNCDECVLENLCPRKGVAKS